MSRRYELTDQEWEQIALLLPPENIGKPGCPSKENRLMLNAMIWLARSTVAWRGLPEQYGTWTSVYSRFRKWIEDGILDNIFRVLSLEAELGDLSIDATIVQAHQYSAGTKKGASKRNRTQPRWCKHQNTCGSGFLRLSDLPDAQRRTA